MRTRSVFSVVLVALIAAGCGNSGSDETAPAATPATTAAPTTTAAAPTTTATPTTTAAPATTTTTTEPPDPRFTFVPLEGVPGVDDEEIAFAVIGIRTNNPLGTCILDCYLDGIEAYFAFRNAEGGLFGRELSVSYVLDDELFSTRFGPWRSSPPTTFSACSTPP